MTNKKILSDLDNVGKILSEAKKAKKQLSAEQLSKCKNVLTTATKELFKLKAINVREAKRLVEKKDAVKKSIAESLMSKEEGIEETKTVISASVSNKIRTKKVQAAVVSVKALAEDVNKLAAEPRLEQLDKGHETSKSIPAPAKAGSKKVVAEGERQEEGAAAVGENASETSSEPAIADPIVAEPVITAEKKEAIRQKVREAIKKKRAQKKEPEKTAEKKAAGKVAEKVAEKKEVKKPVFSNKIRAKNMYVRAMELLRDSEKEKDAVAKEAMVKRANMMEKMADALLSNTTKTKKEASVKTAVKTAVEKKASETSKASEASEKEATTITFAAEDSVLMPDGAVGQVSSVVDDKLTVSIGGMEKEVMADAVKKITSMKKKEETGKEKKSEKIEKKAEAKQGASIVDKVKSAISVIRGSKKKTAQEDGLTPAPAMTEDTLPPAPAITEDAPVETKEEVAKSVGDPVTSAEAKSIAYMPEVGWTVTISENEVLSFGEDKDAAESFVAQGSKQGSKKDAAADKVIDSADTAEPEGRESGQKKMRGLDQKSKDYGTTTKEEKVNAERSMIGKASKEKTATDKTKDSPVDSATTKTPDGTETIQSKMRGLSQKGKDYGTTSADQKVDPKLSVYARKIKVLSNTNEQQNNRLKVLEADGLADRAVKVGAITEEQLSEQREVLAELYSNDRAQFRAYARLIENLEKVGSSKTIANRSVKKVQAAFTRKSSELVDGLSSGNSGTLENGTLFEDE